MDQVHIYGKGKNGPIDAEIRPTSIKVRLPFTDDSQVQEPRYGLKV